MSMNTFPTFVGLGFDIKKRPAFSTSNDVSAAGTSYRTSRWVIPHYDFDVQINYLSQADRDTLEAFFNQQLGSGIPFLLSVTNDNSQTNRSFGTGDGAKVSFQLPVPARTGVTSSTLYDNGGAAGAATVSATGLVTFTTAPLTGHALTWTGTYVYVVQFKDDIFEFNQMLSQMYEAPTVLFRTVADYPSLAAQAPTIMSFNPTIAATNSTITITGKYFTGATSVTINGVSASFTVVSDTTISATVPGVSGSGTVTVTTPSGTATSTQTFTAAFNPASLFVGGRKGFCWDFSDPTKLFQLSTAATAVAAVNDPIGYVTDLSGNGINGTQATAGSRPLWGGAGGGAVGDGIAKWMTAGNIDFTTTNKLTVIACVQTSSATYQSLYQHGTSFTGDVNVGMSVAFKGTGNWNSIAFGPTHNTQVYNSRGAPGAAFEVVTSAFDLTQSTALTQIAARINGEVYGAVQGVVGPCGSTTFSNNPSIIMKDYAGDYLNGKLIRILVIDRLLTAAEMLAVETWAGGSGAQVNIIAEPMPVGPTYYNVVNTYGQSLSCGAIDAGTMLLSTTTRFNDVMFGEGVHAFAGGVPALTSLVPLVEGTANQSATPEGETPISGCFEMIHELGSLNPFIGYGSGFPATTIAGCQSGNSIYNDFKTGVTAAWRRARELTVPQYCKMRAFTWMQGEDDSGQTSAATYAAAMNTLQTSLNTDIKAITGQTEDVWMISYQLDRPDIALQQLTASNTYSFIRVAMPVYHLPHQVSKVHMTALGYKLAGAYFGIAYKAIIIDGNTAWQPLKCTSSTVTGGTQIDLTFNPVGSLAFDTTLVASQVNQGFNLQDNANNPLTINSVSLVGTNVVRIIAASALPAGAQIKYGFANSAASTPGGGLGNLRDTQGNTIVFNGGGLNYPLHNWCVLFQRTVN